MHFNVGRPRTFDVQSRFSTSSSTDIGNLRGLGGLRGVTRHYHLDTLTTDHGVQQLRLRAYEGEGYVLQKQSSFPIPEPNLMCQIVMTLKTQKDESPRYFSCHKSWLAIVDNLIGFSFSCVSQDFLPDQFTCTWDVSERSMSQIFFCTRIPETIFEMSDILNDTLADAMLLLKTLNVANGANSAIGINWRLLRVYIDTSHCRHIACD